VPLLTVIVNYVGLPPSVSLHDLGGEPFGLSSVVDGRTTIRDSIHPGNGYYVEVTGAPPVSFSGQVSAFDLGGPVDGPEPPTWAMLCLGFAGLALVASVRTAMGKKRAA
jgi:hypothetical protein